MFAWQDAVFGIAHDDAIRQSVRASKAPEDAMEMGTLAEKLAELDLLLKEEDDKVIIEDELYYEVCVSEASAKAKGVFTNTD